MATETTPRGTGRRPQAGPPQPLTVIVFAVLTVAAVIVNRSVPHPDASAAEVLAYDLGHQDAIKWGSFLLFGSSIPLAITAAVTYRRLRALGITAPGSAIALVGGVLAAVALMLSGLLGWAGGRLPADAPPALAKALQDMAFATGGPAFAVSLGLLIAGIAVPGLLVRLLPRPVAVIGLVIAVAGAISTLSVVALGFGPAIPVVRFGGIAWLIVAAFMLPRTRHEMRD